MKTIIITDKNPHIRMLISREFEGLNCNIEKDFSQDEIIENLKKTGPVYTIILDPEALTVNPLIFLKKIIQISPETIVIIHAYDEWRDIFYLTENLFFIEKNGESIENVKRFVQSKAFM
ncbi:MAG: hypothetical protein H6681_01030 [Desulfobacteraceae bacterium]|nr:hypothetical protein [Desulfobacteraceae bacterium]